MGNEGMGYRPLVSIIINNYNYGRYLGAAIESALGQTYARVEVVVVDDGSTDDSRVVIARHVGRVVPVYKANGGQASAFNAGVAASRGDILCFLDADDAFLPHKVAAAVDAFARHDDADAIFHALEPANDALMPLARPGRAPAAALGLQEWDLRARMRRGGMPEIPTATSGCCFRRRLLARILPMPEAQGVSLHDNYLKFAAAALGKALYSTEALALQRLHAGNHYTGRETGARSLALKARMCVVTAYYLRERFPELARFTDNLMASGIGLYWGAGGVATPYRGMVSRYLSSLSPTARLALGGKALYFWLEGRGGRGGRGGEVVR